MTTYVLLGLGIALVFLTFSTLRTIWVREGGLEGWRRARADVRRIMESRKDER